MIPMAFQITRKEFYLGVVFAILGFIFSSSEYISYRLGLNALVGLLLSYVMLYATLFILGKLDLITWNVMSLEFRQWLGFLLILFSFMVITDWSSAYYSSQSLANPDIPIPQSEGGAVYYFWVEYAGIQDPSQLRILTFMLTPLVLSLAGAFLVKRKIQI